MDRFDLFKELSFGAKFDLKRFKKDAERFNLLKPERKTESVLREESTSHDVPKHNKRSKSDTDDIKENDEESDDNSLLSSDDENSESDSSEDSDNIKTAETELKILGNITSSTNALKKKKKLKNETIEKAAALKQEGINHIRKLHRIHIHGTDIPDPEDTFDGLEKVYNIHPQIMENIRTVGYQQPTPIQMQAIPAMLHRRELMACAPTGSGKTAAFIIPILHHLKEPKKQGIRALVLAPTRELAKQIHGEFQRLSQGRGFKILYFESSSTMEKKSFKKFDVCVSTPNRLVYMLKEDPPTLKLNNVEWLVVDESDKLFEEGKSGFRDQLAIIYKACTSSSVCRAMFSATFAYDVEQWCKLNLDNVAQVYIGARNSATESIKQELKFVGTESGKLIAIRDLIRQGISPPVLVFVQSKERAQELFGELIYENIHVDVIHSGRTQEQRDNTVKSFRAGKIWVLICTELMGRGIDFKGVNLVINYDFPNSAIGYIHRIGRTGRAGRTGEALTLFTEDDAVHLKSIANLMKEAGCPVPEYMLQIKRPTRKKRKKLAKRIPKRERISTSIKHHSHKHNRKRKHENSSGTGQVSSKTKGDKTSAADSKQESTAKKLKTDRKFCEDATSKNKELPQKKVKGKDKFKKGKHKLDQRKKEKRKQKNQKT